MNHSGRDDAPLLQRRDDFPLLQRRIGGAPIVYLDSAATSLTPQPVIAAAQACATRFTANVHRGAHALAEEASFAYESARRRIARFINAEPGSVVFVRNTTEALNLVAAGLSLPPEAIIATVGGAHHSNLIPWSRCGQVVMDRHVPTSPTPVADIEEVLARHRPGVLAITYVSNVTGVVQAVAELCRVARAHGVVTVVDAAQAAPHMRLDVARLGCDFLAFSGHKMLGPTGIGVLYGRPERLAALTPLLVGGGMLERVEWTDYTLKPVPHRFEAGTPNIGGAIALAAAVQYLEDLGFAALEDHSRRLAAALARAVQSLPGCRVLMAEGEPRLPVATIVPTEAPLEAQHLAQLLSSRHNIMTRSGYHCAAPLFHALGIERGSLRISGYLYNTLDEIQLVQEALNELLSLGVA